MEAIAYKLPLSSNCPSDRQRAERSHLHLVKRSARPARVQDANKQFEQLYREHFQSVVRALTKHGVRSADTEDVAQEVFAIVLRRIDDYDPARPFSSWVAGIARRVAADYRRLARHRRLELGAADEHACPELDPEHDLLRNETARWVDGGLSALSPARREVLLMCEVGGMTAREVGEQLGISPNTVSSRLRRGRREFARVMGARVG